MNTNSAKNTAISSERNLEISDLDIYGQLLFAAKLVLCLFTRRGILNSGMYILE